MSKRIVIALGGNALGTTLPEQATAVKTTARAIVDLIEDGNEVIVAHGNGPQVGIINNAMMALMRADPTQGATPLSVCGAMSQAYIGYDLQNALREELFDRGITTKPVVTMVTQVEVDPDDPAFQNPTKPIGKFLSEEEAKRMAEATGFLYKEDAGRGWRRYVASPKPKHIIEAGAIRALTEDGHIVICCGGGGIPVIVQDHALQGASAVIEKDDIAGKLAADLHADRLLILTSVPNVYLNFGKPNQKPISSMNVETASSCIREGQFGETDMLPKIQAAITYLAANPAGEAIITTADEAVEALAGRAGTVITA